MRWDLETGSHTAGQPAATHYVHAETDEPSVGETRAGAGTQATRSTFVGMPGAKSDLTGATAPIAVIQARMSSERLPGKVLLDLGGRPVLDWVVTAARDSGAFREVVVATSTGEEDEAVAAHCASSGFATTRGPLDDVLARYLQAAHDWGAASLVRLTADCPLLDPLVIRDVANAFASALPNISYVSNTIVRTLPRGLDCEAVSVEALRLAADAADDLDREHVTRGLLRHPDRFRQFGIVYPEDASCFRVTVDTEDDLLAVRAIVADLGEAASRSASLVRYLKSHPDVAALNASVPQKGA